jgi:hypothetical protein
MNRSIIFKICDILLTVKENENLIKMTIFSYTDF